MATLSLPSFAQQTKPADTAPARTQEQKPFKEVKFKLEWTTISGATPQAKTNSSYESVVVSAVLGQSTMTTNPVQSADIYRRVIIQPEIQADGSYIVGLSVSEFGKDQDRDIPRVETSVKVRTGDTKVVQDRVSKGTNYEFEYLFTITPVIE
jgi:hypothetical protein